MRRNYLDSMKTDGFGEFLSACDAIKNCKYVLSDSKITALLKSIADNKQIYSMFAMALYEFDYNATFSECLVNKTFRLPSNPKKAIALVFRILLDIDGGKMELKNFLEAYFYSPMINESYARFCLEVIVPFEAHCKALFSQPVSLQDIPFGENGIENAYEEVSDRFRADLKGDALVCLNMLEKITVSALNAEIDRNEMSVVLDGLVSAISTDDYERVKSAFLGVKFAVAYFFKNSQSVLEIYKKLEYDIKHLQA